MMYVLVAAGPNSISLLSRWFRENDANWARRFMSIRFPERDYYVFPVLGLLVDLDPSIDPLWLMVAA